MNTPIRAILCLFIAGTGFLQLSGCHDNVSGSDQIEGSGRLVSRDLSLSTFDAIQLTGIGEVEIRQDTLQSVRVTADDNIIDRLRVSVTNGVLTIGIEPGSYNRVTVQVAVSMRNVASLTVSGAGTIATAAPIQVTTLSTIVSGAGSISVSGSASDHNALISGSGAVHAFDLIAAHCTVIVSGQGTAEVYATQSLDATVSGMGNIIFDGNPASVSQHVTGLGSVSSRH